MILHKKIDDKKRQKSQEIGKNWKDALKELSQMGQSLDNLHEYIQINFN